MRLKRAPQPALRPFVQAIWIVDATRERPTVEARREHVLPTGQMHLVFRLGNDPLRVFENANDISGYVVSHAVVGGARASYYIRDVTQPLCSVGALLRPGAAHALFGAPADQIAERHSPLEDFWGTRVADMRDELADLNHLEQRLDVFEEMLAARLPRARGLHPVVAQALEQFTTTADVHDVVSQSGYSHRAFISLFRSAVGLTPKLYCRVRRFRRALQRLSTTEAASWTDVAIAAGYSDQSHFNRDFREFAGVTPTDYRAVSPSFPHHLPIDVGRR